MVVKETQELGDKGKHWLTVQEYFTNGSQKWEIYEYEKKKKRFRR